MNADHTAFRAPSLRTFNILSALFVVAVGMMVLVGWALDIAVLKSILPIWVSMKANTAVCFILMAIALWLTTIRPPSQNAPLNSNYACFISLLNWLTDTE